MNSEPEDKGDIEKDLVEFEYAPLPADWKAEKIDNALAESSGSPPEQKVVRFSGFQKIAITGIAAAWVTIAALQMTMPGEAGRGEEEIAAEIAPAEAQAPADLPLLVHYIEARNAMTTRF